MVQPQHVHPSCGGHSRCARKKRLARTWARHLGFIREQGHPPTEVGRGRKSAIPRGILQPPEPCEFPDSTSYLRRYRGLATGNQSDRWYDHRDHHHVSPDSTCAETHILVPWVACRKVGDPILVRPSY